MSLRAPHILIIDDDTEIIDLLERYLCQNGYKITSSLHGLTLLTLIKKHLFDLIILDVMLPAIDGLTLCKTIRGVSDIPIIMLSAAQSTADRVAGLELGADDYIAKPFEARELLARIKAQIRRSNGALSNNEGKKLAPLKKIHFAHWILDRDTHALIDAEGIAIALSQKEYDLLLIFLEHSGRILNRDLLMDFLYDKSFDPQDRTIDVLIGRIRKKIELDPRKPKLIVTVRGGGYQLKSPVQLL